MLVACGDYNFYLLAVKSKDEYLNYNQAYSVACEMHSLHLILDVFLFNAKGMKVHMRRSGVLGSVWDVLWEGTLSVQSSFDQILSIS